MDNLHLHLDFQMAVRLCVGRSEIFDLDVGGGNDDSNPICFNRISIRRCTAAETIITQMSALLDMNGGINRNDLMHLIKCMLCRSCRQEDVIHQQVQLMSRRLEARVRRWNITIIESEVHQELEGDRIPSVLVDELRAEFVPTTPTRPPPSANVVPGSDTLQTSAQHQALQNTAAKSELRFRAAQTAIQHMQAQIASMQDRLFHLEARPAVPESAIPLSPPIQAGTPQAEPTNSNRPQEGQPCPICTEEMRATEKLTTCLRQCYAVMHQECMDGWVAENMGRGREVTCPYCRAVWL